MLFSPDFLTLFEATAPIMDQVCGCCCCFFVFFECMYVPVYACMFVCMCVCMYTVATETLHYGDWYPSH
jgi:hypothetical protein